jgi:Cu/Ag efflux protein CusF
MKRLQRAIAIIAATVVMAAVGFSQGTAAKKALTFHGKVEGVDAKSGKLTVNGDKVDGWMEAMTMDYKVDDPAVLSKVKPGDRIAATVYADDMVLHKVMVMPKTGAAKSDK